MMVNGRLGRRTDEMGAYYSHCAIPFNLAPCPPVVLLERGYEDLSISGKEDPLHRYKNTKVNLTTTYFYHPNKNVFSFPCSFLILKHMNV